MCILPQGISAQKVNSTTTEPFYSNYELRPHYFSFGLDASTIYNVKAGFSLGYVHRLDKRNHHYVGLHFSGFPSSKNNTMNVLHYNYPTKNGEVKTDLAIINFELIHYYFFTPAQKNSFFINSGIGIQSIRNDISTSYYYYSGFPFGWLPNGDDLSLSSNSFSAKVEGGYWYNWIRNRGLYAKFGFNYSNSFKIIDGYSAYYDTNGSLHFSTYDSNAFYITLGLGMLF